MLSRLWRRLDANGEVENGEFLLTLGRQRLLLGDRRRLGAKSEVELPRNREEVFLGADIARGGGDILRILRILLILLILGTGEVARSTDDILLLLRVARSAGDSLLVLGA